MIKKLGLIGIVILAVFAIVKVSRVNVYALGDPIKISTSTNAPVAPQIVTDSNGYLHITWMEVANENSQWGGNQNPGILYSRWNGDTWSTPITISQNTGFAETPTIAVDSNNTVYVAWDDETYGGGLPKAVIKSRSSSGTWSSIETLPTPSGTGKNLNARVAIGASNVPHVTYGGTELDGSGTSIYWTKKVSGSWTTPELISDDLSGSNILTGCEWSDIKSDASGNIHVVYWCSANGPFVGGIFYRKYNGTSWSTPIAISQEADVELTKIAITPAGEIFVTWFENIDNSIHVRWTISGTWQNDTTLATAGYRAFWGYPIMGITTDSNNRTHIGWGEQDGGGLIDLKYRTYTGGSWQSAQPVDLDNNQADSPFVFPDKWDNQHFTWTERNPSNNLWEIYYRVAEGTIQSVGTGGATVTSNPGGTTYATLTIPSGALSATTQISIQVGPVPESVSSSQITIPRSFTFRPHGLTFTSPSTATVFYTDAEVVGVDERELKPWFWNSTLNDWEAKTGTVNRPQNKIAVSLNGFSLYGISAPIVNINWVKPAPHYTHTSTKGMAVEFTMTNADGSRVPTVDVADDLKIDVLNGLGQVIKSYPLGPNTKTVPAPTFFSKIINPSQDGIPNGNYTLQVYLVGNPVGSPQPFTISL